MGELAKTNYEVAGLPTGRVVNIFRGLVQKIVTPPFSIESRGYNSNMLYTQAMQDNARINELEAKMAKNDAYLIEVATTRSLTNERVHDQVFRITEQETNAYADKIYALKHSTLTAANISSEPHNR